MKMDDLDIGIQIYGFDKGFSFWAISFILTA